MESKFKEFMTGLATDTSEESKYSAEDLQAVIDEVNAKDTEIQSLKDELEKRNKEHEELKNRIVDKLFSNPKGKPLEDEDKNSDSDDEPVKTFDQLILPEYQNRN